MTSRAELDRVVKSATAEAAASRLALGNVYAAEFSKDPDRFDPHKLMTLGPGGLSSFVAAVGVPTVDIVQPSDQPGKPMDSNDESGGWEAQRYIPIPFELYGLILGTFTGVAIIFGIALAQSL